MRRQSVSGGGGGGGAGAGGANAADHQHVIKLTLERVGWRCCVADFATTTRKKWCFILELSSAT